MVFCSLIASSAIRAFISALKLRRCLDFISAPFPRQRFYTLLTGPNFGEHLNLNPPEQAIVLCVDEKSQIQALDRTQPGLPMKKGRCGTMTHDYKRNGTTTLFAALEMA